MLLPRGSGSPKATKAKSAYLQLIGSYTQLKGEVEADPDKAWLASMVQRLKHSMDELKACSNEWGVDFLKSSDVKDIRKKFTDEASSTYGREWADTFEPRLRAASDDRDKLVSHMKIN